ncbi:MAG: pseudaminic acid biosynthesis-associated methylase [Lentisphaerae bacterium GWF2_44_16]|nr:MAG: pseudaminic acid biosynthesis-associated methylase [Lentisphaerae bacterium GWF2_44_16]
MKKYKTEQEKFWAEKFGTEYIERNKSAEILNQNVFLFSRILSKMEKIKSAIEYGANIGLNLRALRTLIPDVELSAVEINKDAVKELKKIEAIKVFNKSILDFQIDRPRDFALIKTVLIHLNPEMLNQVYELLYESSRKYICIAEFYNPVPVEINYRGFSEKLFKRDFAGEMLDKYDDLKLVDYGFCYHRDIHFPKTDITWFLMEKI